MEVHSNMAKGVRKSSQMTLKMSGRGVKYKNPSVSKTRFNENRTWMIGKTPGTSLEDYVLDLMKLT